MKHLIIQFASLIFLLGQLTVFALPTDKQSLDTLPRDVIDRIISNHLDGVSASKFSRASNKTRNYVLGANYLLGQENAEQFTSKQYVYIKRFIQAYDAFAPMNIRHLNLIREIFNGTEKVVGGKQKMAERLKKAIRLFGTPPLYNEALKNDDVFRVKIYIDYFGFNEKSYWRDLFSLNQNSKPKITKFVRNSQYLLSLTTSEESFEKFVKVYNSLRDESSLNIVSTQPGETRFILSKFNNLNDQDKAFYEFILSQGSEFDVNAKFVRDFGDGNQYYDSRLGFALKEGVSDDFNGAKFLLYYPNVDIDTVLSPWPSYHVLTHYSISALQFLLSRKNVDINAGDGVGDTALYIMTVNSKPEIIRFLLTRPGIDTNVKSKFRVGYTALMYAATNNNVEIVQDLLNFPTTDVNVQNKNGQTALVLAIDFRAADTARILIQQPGINIRIRDRWGNNAMFYAKKHNMNEIVEMLNLKNKETQPQNIFARVFSRFLN